MKRFRRRFPDVIGIAIALITVISIANATSVSGSSAFMPDITTSQPELQTLLYIPYREVEKNEDSETIDFGMCTITAYCSCEKCCEEYGIDRPVDKNGNTIVYTASGAIAKHGTTIAADPLVFPYGTHIVIDGHTYIVQDCGGSIKGDRLDIYFDNHQDALNWGVQEKEVYIERSVEK